MENEFLANIQNEGERIDEKPLSESETGEKETTPASPAEKEPSGEPESPAAKEEVDPSEKSEEEPAVYNAFHKHPRFQAIVRERDELKSENDELKKFKEEAEPLLSRIKGSEEEIPPEFSTLFGNDANAWKQFQSLNERQQETFWKKVEEKLKPVLETAEQTKRQKELESWAEQEWKSLKEDPEIQKELKSFGKNLDDAVQEDISRVIAKYLPTDDKTGNLSARKGYELWKALEASKPKPSPSATEKKKVADMTNEKSNAEQPAKDFQVLGFSRGKTLVDLS